MRVKSGVMDGHMMKMMMDRGCSDLISNMFMTFAARTLTAYFLFNYLWVLITSNKRSCSPAWV